MEPHIVSFADGKFNVVNEFGQIANELPLDKEQAEAMLRQIKSTSGQDTSGPGADTKG